MARASSSVFGGWLVLVCDHASAGERLDSDRRFARADVSPMFRWWAFLCDGELGLVELCGVWRGRCVVLATAAARL